ncbi:glycosyltransferase [Microbacterium sp. KNMS]
MSVVVPLFNKERVVGRALDSIVRQTISQWEVIIVDDGSTDASRDVVRDFLKDDRVTYVHQANAGPGAARNHGMKLARADFVAFLDADDEWKPQFLEEALQVVASDPGVSVVVAGWYRPSDGVESRFDLQSRGVLPGAWGLREGMPPSSLLKRMIDALHSSACLVRTETARELGGFYAQEHCTFGEDAFLWGRLIFSDRVVHYLDKTLVVFHTDASSLSHGRAGAYPVPPLLTRSDLVIAEAPRELRAGIRAYLRWYAAWVGRRALQQRAPSVAIGAGLSWIKLSLRFRGGKGAWKGARGVRYAEENVLVRTLPLGNANYGGIIQAYALQQVIRELGGRPWTDRTRADSHGLVTAWIRRQLGRPWALRIPARIVGKARHRQWERESIHGVVAAPLLEFVKSDIDTVRLYRGGRPRNKVARSFRRFVVGSDQVWRRAYGDVRSYLFDFVHGSDVRIVSYAASFGHDNLDEYGPELIRQSGALARRFDAISVREDSAVDLCEREWGVSAQHHVDPTMLLPKAHYDRLALRARRERVSIELLAYVLDQSEAMQDSVSAAADCLGAAITPLMPPAPSSYRELSVNPEPYLRPTMEDWLSCFQDARFVITDSFHGTVFAILNEKPFITVANAKRGATRMESLLRTFGLEDRLLVDPSRESVAPIVDKPIDWPEVRRRLQIEAARGRDYLADTLMLSGKSVNNR